MFLPAHNFYFTSFWIFDFGRIKEFILIWRDFVSYQLLFLSEKWIKDDNFNKMMKTLWNSHKKTKTQQPKLTNEVSSIPWISRRMYFKTPAGFTSQLLGAQRCVVLKFGLFHTKISLNFKLILFIIFRRALRYSV